MIRAWTSALALGLAILGTAPIANAADITEGLKFFGFLDTSYKYDFSNGENSFAMDEVELDLEKGINDRAGFRVDLNHLNGQKQTTDNIVEQGYIWYGLKRYDVKFTFGKFNAPIGLEAQDPVDMHQVSHSMLFDYGVPKNLTGAMASGYTKWFDYSVYIVNGWDKIEDDNTAKTFGARVAFNIVDAVDVGLSFITGAEGEEPTDDLTVFDVDLSSKYFDSLLIGGEFNMGSFTGQSNIVTGDDATWTAWLLMAKYFWDDQLSFTARLENFDDKDGARLGSFFTENRTAFTISPTYLLTEELTARAEFKYTSSDEKVFPDRDGVLQGNKSEIAFELFYQF